MDGRSGRASKKEGLAESMSVVVFVVVAEAPRRLLSIPFFLKKKLKKTFCLKIKKNMFGKMSFAALEVVA